MRWHNEKWINIYDILYNCWKLNYRVETEIVAEWVNYNLLNSKGNCRGITITMFNNNVEQGLECTKQDKEKGTKKGIKMIQKPGGTKF